MATSSALVFLLLLVSSDSQNILSSLCPSSFYPVFTLQPTLWPTHGRSFLVLLPSREKQNAAHTLPGWLHSHPVESITLIWQGGSIPPRGTRMGARANMMSCTLVKIFSSSFQKSFSDLAGFFFQYNESSLAKDYGQFGRCHLPAKLPSHKENATCLAIKGPKNSDGHGVLRPPPAGIHQGRCKAWSEKGSPAEPQHLTTGSQLSAHTPVYPPVASP